ncbi:zinc finger protein ZPR1-like isoform X3 [Cynara cardunculus var. scolymus]|uniref:zinc finger protein ZPR1-like isoform X3 n=2 Tax=Cynara cardunculus var. scolymus TaxID=59895 RepID=UPI000D62C327|nr:zinc finger protein ZPR1-like isoform X3 [Cynara cardunculus var. scolymus]
METSKDSTIMDVRSVVEAVSTDDDDAPVYQVESLCMRCGENGTTRFLLTLIPHFRKILLSAFECPHCDERNNEVQFAGEIQPRGSCYRLEFSSGDQKMLNRQVVKSETATIKIPQLDFEIPPESQRGSLSTVEGILVRGVDELQALQEERKKVDPQTAEAIDEFIHKLRACATGNSSFTFILDDPAGNSFIENPYAPSPDPSLTIDFYERTPEQQALLGYLVDQSQTTEHGNDASSNNQTSQPHGSVGAVAGRRAIAQGNNAEFAEALFRYTAPEEVMTFPSTCGACAVRCETRMFVTKIPYFQEVIVMASTCDACGYRNSELKAGGAIPAKGKRVTLLVKHVEDLSRDVIKVLKEYMGSLSEIVLMRIEEADGWTSEQDLSSNALQLLSIEEPWTLVLDDAMANSFIAPVTDDIKDDHQLTFNEYERSWEQNEELGLNDMDTSSADAAYASTNAS